MTLLIASPIDRLDPQTVTQVKELLSEAEVGFEQGAHQLVPGELFALRALLYWRQEAVQQAVNDARQALALLPENEVLWRGFAEHVLGVEALFNGQLLLARRTFQKTRALGQRLFTQTTSALPAWTWGKGLFTQTVTVLLAWTCYQQGDLRLAAEYYHQVLSETRESDERHARVHALLGLAGIAYEWNDLDEAGRLAQEASLLGRHLADAVNQVRAELLTARILLARGETESALKLLLELPARIQIHLLPHLEQEILAEQARLHLALGDIVVVQRWAAECARQPQKELPHFQYEQEALLLARLHLAQNHNREALTDLQYLLEETPESEHSRIGLNIHVLLALAEAANQQGAQALQQIQTVLPLAQTEGYQRLFLDEGEAMERLLRSVAPHVQGASLKTYLQQLLQLFGPTRADSSAAPLAEPLSPQEMRVLRLLATGSSAPQIAQHLVVSVTTVRTQIQSIYRKLRVNNRVAASEAARSLHLL